MKTITSDKQLNFNVFFSQDASNEKILDWVEENLDKIVRIEKNWDDVMTRYEDGIDYRGDDESFSICIEQVKTIF